MASENKNEDIKTEMDPIIEELKRKGIKHNSKETEMVGLGDLVEETLKKLGITEERFKQWFDLKECNCTERKKFLNNLFSWRKQT
jgi:copper oxidase (laccase) domain-containing protein